MSEEGLQAAARVAGFIEATGCPIKVIAEDSGISEPELSRIRNGKSVLEEMKLLKIGRAIGKWETRGKVFGR